MNGRGLLIRPAVALGFCSTMLILQVMALIAASFGGRGNILYTISVIFLAMQCFLSSYCDGREGISIWWQSNIGNVIISVVICVVMLPVFRTGALPLGHLFHFINCQKVHKPGKEMRRVT